MGTTSPDNQIMSDETVHAPIKWAQRKDRVFVTLGVQDVTGETISLTETKLSFSGTDGSGVGYATDIEFFEEIDAAASSYVVRDSDDDDIPGLDDEDDGPPPLE